MSILSKILTVAGIAAAPFSGGASLGLTAGGGILSKLGKVGQIAGQVAPILGGAAKERAGAQEAAERNQLGRDRLNLDAASDRDRSITNRAGLDLQRREFQTTAPGQRLSTGVRGSIAANAHNVTVGSGAPITLPSGKVINPIHYGGMGPDDLMSPEARQLGEQTTHDMLMQEMGGDKFDALPDTQFPNASPAPQSSGIDKMIGAGAGVSGILGALPGIIDIFKKNKPQMSLMDGEDDGQ